MEKIKRMEDGEPGRVKSWKILWSMLMEFIFGTLGSCWRTLRRAVIESEVHFRHITLADGKEDGLGDEKLETKTEQED